MNVQIIEQTERRTRLRVTAEPTNPEWQARPGKEPWCEVTIYDGERVGSFGGEVWPGAWPEWFEFGKPTAQVPLSCRLTEAGQAALLPDDDEPRGTTPGCPDFRGNC